LNLLKCELRVEDPQTNIRLHMLLPMMNDMFPSDCMLMDFT